MRVTMLSNAYVCLSSSSSSPPFCLSLSFCQHGVLHWNAHMTGDTEPMLSVHIVSCTARPLPTNTHPHRRSSSPGMGWRLCGRRNRFLRLQGRVRGVQTRDVGRPRYVRPYLVLHCPSFSCLSSIHVEGARTLFMVACPSCAWAQYCIIASNIIFMY